MEVMYHLIDSHPSLWRERSATTAELVGFLHNVNYEARNMNEVCMFSRSERNGVATRSVWPVQWLDWTKRRLGLMALSLVLGILAACGEMLRSQGDLVWSLVGLVHGLCYAAIAFMFVLLLELGMRWLSREDNAQATYRISFRHNFRGWGVLFLIIVLCWMPYVIALYPGVMWYDTSNQLLQWNHLPNLFTDGQLTDHHPIADTAIFGLFVQFGNLIGSGDLGIFLYTMIQTVVTASAMAYCLLYMRRIGASHRLCMAALAFVSLFPIFPMYSSPMVKDSLFLPIMVLFGVQCVEIVRSRGEVLRRTSFWGTLIGLALALSLTKKTGMYIAILVCLLLVAVTRRGLRRRLIVVVAAVAAVMMIMLPKVVFPLADVAPGGKQEMLSIPFQQSARLLRYYGDAILKEQRDAIERVLGEDVAQRYAVTSADAVKGYVWDSEKDRYLLPYAKAWLQGLAEHPLTYVEAFLGMESAWLALPNAGDEHVGDLLMPVYAQGTNHSFFEGHEQLGLTASDTTMASRVEHLIDWAERTPVGMMLFSRAIWTTWMTAFVVYECLRRRRHDGWLRLLGVTPLVVSYCFLWISPVSGSIESMRYMVPQVYIMPLAFAVLAVRSMGTATTQPAGIQAVDTKEVVAS